MNWAEYFYYDESSPTCLRWAVERRSGQHKNIVNKSVGDVAGTVGLSDYANVQVNGKLFKVHKVVYELVYSISTHGAFVDHVDGDIHNNKASNLRLTTKAVNCRNQKMRTNNSSGITGVRYSATGNRWVATWCDEQGVGRGKSFSVKKFGAAAKDLAVDARAKAIAKLNSTGSGYTERHGL